MDRFEPFSCQARQRPAHRTPLATHHAGRHDPAWTRGVGGKALLQRQIEDDGHARPPVALGQADQRQAIPGPHVRGVDHGQQARSKPRVGRSMKLKEHLLRGCLVARVTKDRLPERI